MKNILSENMLRFGVKNLSESNKKNLTENFQPVELTAGNDTYGKHIFAQNTKYGFTPSTDGAGVNFYLASTDPDTNKSYQTTIVGGKFNDTALDKLVVRIMDLRNGPMILKQALAKQIMAGGNTGTLRQNITQTLKNMLSQAKNASVKQTPG